MSENTTDQRRLTAIRIKDGDVYSDLIPISVKSNQVKVIQQLPNDERIVRSLDEVLEDIDDQLDTKANKTETVSNVTWDSQNSELIQTINENSTTIVNKETLKNDLEIGKAFSTIAVGENTIVATSSEDTLILSGNNININKEENEKKINISIDIDDQLSASSTNLVQNNVIYEALNNKTNQSDFEAYQEQVATSLKNLNIDGTAGGKGLPATIGHTPQMDGEASIGATTTGYPFYAHWDHVHPSDTSKLNVSAIKGWNNIENKGKLLAFDSNDVSTIVPSSVSLSGLIKKENIDSTLDGHSDNPVKNSVIKTALDNKLSLSGGEVSGLIRFNSGGITFKESNQDGDNQYYALQEKDGDLFIGGDVNSANYHVGQVFINTGYDESTAKGNDSIYLQIPGSLITPRVLRQGLTDIGDIGFSGKVTLASNNSTGLDCNYSRIINVKELNLSLPATLQSSGGRISWPAPLNSKSSLYALNNILYFQPQTSPNSSKALLWDDKEDCGSITFAQNKTLINNNFAINLNGGDITNFNSLWANGVGTSAGQGGINWKNSSSGLTWDSLFANNGKLYFAPNTNANSINPTKYEVIHKNNLYNLIYTKNISFIETQVANNTARTLGENGTNKKYITIPAGKWIVTCSVRFQSNSTGYRSAWLTYDENGTENIFTAARVHMAPAEGTNTYLNFSFPLVINNPTDYYLAVKQNSGSDLLIAGWIRYIGIKKV